MQLSRASRARRGTDAAPRVFASRPARRPPERRRAGVPPATLRETLQMPQVRGRWPSRLRLHLIEGWLQLSEAAMI